MAYNHFRYIAFQIPTVGVDNSNNFLEMPAGVIDFSSRYSAGFPSPIDGITNPDAKDRVARFWAALSDAKAMIKNNLIDTPDTLKIFVAPEFYFRPTTKGSKTLIPGPSYTYQEYKEIKSALRTLIYSDDFVNWIVIAGTIMWSAPGNIGKRPGVATDTVFFNSAIVIKIGHSLSNKSSKVVEKVASSTIDGFPTNYHGLTGTFPPTNKASDEAFTYYQSDEKKRKHVFDHEGTSLGLEICAEHVIGNMKETLRDWVPGPGNDRKKISLHIMTCAGKDIERKNVAAGIGGYIMRNDGYGKKTEILIELRKVTGYSNKGFGQGLSVPMFHKPSYAVLNVSEPIEKTIPLDKLEEIPKPTNGNSDYYFKQEVRIYYRQPFV